MEKNTNDVEDWEKRTPPSFEEMKKKQKELEDKGVFKNNEKKKEQVMPSEEKQEMPPPQTKEIDSTCHTVSGYHAWTLTHGRDVKISQFMSWCEATDEEIWAAIKKMVKGDFEGKGRQKLLAIIDFTYKISGIEERRSGNVGEESATKS